MPKRIDYPIPDQTGLINAIANRIVQEIVDQKLSPIPHAVKELARCLAVPAMTHYVEVTAFELLRELGLIKED